MTINDILLAALRSCGGNMKAFNKSVQRTACLIDDYSHPYVDEETALFEMEKWNKIFDE